MSVNYIRISVTDRCNLRCFYCMPNGCEHKISHNNILRYEEIDILIDILADIGISNVRLTGGEPLVRKGIHYLLSSISQNPAIKRTCITTNLIADTDTIKKLNDIALNGINISIDSLNSKTFESITGVNALHILKENISSLTDHSLKTNTVLLKDINDNEIIDIAEFAHANNAIPRFIEYMDMTGDASTYFVSSSDIIKTLQKKGFIHGNPFRFYDESAAFYYHCSNDKIIGFISPETHRFCKNCSRLRLSADGKLYSCLYSHDHIDLKSMLRNNTSHTIIKENITALIQRKRHHEHSLLIRSMNSIGG